MIERVTACFIDHRSPDLVVHGLPALVAQRIVGIALGYEDISDHDDLWHDPVLALLLADRLRTEAGRRRRSGRQEHAYSFGVCAGRITGTVPQDRS